MPTITVTNLAISSTNVSSMKFSLPSQVPSGATVTDISLTRTTAPRNTSNYYKQVRFYVVQGSTFVSIDNRQMIGANRTNNGVGVDLVNSSGPWPLDADDTKHFDRIIGESQIGFFMRSTYDGKQKTDTQARFSLTITYELPSGTVKYYDGSDWVECSPYYYDGTGFAEAEPSRYDGSAWVECSH